jgi:hypothetical protein
MKRPPMNVQSHPAAPPQPTPPPDDNDQRLDPSPPPTTDHRTNAPGTEGDDKAGPPPNAQPVPVRQDR